MIDKLRNGVREGVTVGAIALGATSCIAPDGDAAPTPAPSVDAEVAPQRLRNELDLLFVIDDSGTMAEEQNNLAGRLEGFLRALTTGDVDGDGQVDTTPATDVHVAFASTDMGTAGFPVPTCSDDGDPDGDDGVLATDGNTMVTGCQATYPNVHGIRAGDDLAAAAAELGCVARIGTGGCGFEQPLEAMLKAITPSASVAVTPFLSGAGHGDRENAGFLREDSVLAVVIMTDEEDCSAADAEIFNTESTTFPGEALNLRCFTYGAESVGAVQPIGRYVDGLVAAVGGDPSRLVFAPIVGVPSDAIPNPEAVDYDTVLAHTNMREEIDPMDPNRLRTSCNVPGLGIAFPPRRIVRLAQEIDRLTTPDGRRAGATVHSLCEADLSPALDAIARRIGARLGDAR